MDVPHKRTCSDVRERACRHRAVRVAPASSRSIAGPERASACRREVVDERAAGPEPWELEIEPGLYKLEDDAGHAIAFDHGGEEVTRVEL
jgi:hypothetical protein